MCKYMTQEIKLVAQKREKGSMSQLRAVSFIPGCLYGPGTENVNLKVKKADFDKVFTQAGESHLIDLTIDGGSSVKVIVKDLQRDAVKNDVLHVDFYKVNKDIKITAEIPLHFVGESKAVKELGGIIAKEMNSVKIKCLPGDLVDFIEIDLSVLANINDAVRMHELKMPNGMEFVSHTDEVVVHVIETKAEAEVASPAPAAVVEEKKGAEEKKA